MNALGILVELPDERGEREFLVMRQQRARITPRDPQQRLFKYSKTPMEDAIQTIEYGQSMSHVNAS